MVVAVIFANPLYALINWPLATGAAQLPNRAVFNHAVLVSVCYHDLTLVGGSDVCPIARPEA